MIFKLWSSEVSVCIRMIERGGSALCTCAERETSFNNQHSNEMARQGQAAHEKPTAPSDAHYLDAYCRVVGGSGTRNAGQLEWKQLRFLPIFELKIGFLLLTPQ